MTAEMKEFKWQDMCLMLPEDWKSPSEELTKKKFPYQQKPQEIFVNPEESRILTLNMLEKPLHEKQVYPAILEIQRMINHIYPESIRERARILKTGAGIIGWFSFVTGGLKSDDCHSMFVIPVDGRMMFGSYHFPIEELEEERTFFLNIMKSIEINSDTGEDGQGTDDGNGIFRPDNTGTQGKIFTK